jgi:hypothetical protein
LKKAVKDQPLGSVVHHVMRDHPAFTASPLGDWQEVVGGDAAQACQPVSLKKGVLVIVTEAPVWMHHLEMHKTALMDFINAKHSEPLVRKIVFRIGALPETAPILNPDHRKIEKIRPRKQGPIKTRKTKPRPLTPEEKAFLKTISDPDLRAMGARLLKHTYPDESS